MKKELDLGHIESMETEVNSLWSAKAYPIDEFIRNPIYGNFCFQGIYVISDIEDVEPVYIGKTNDGTKENGLADRIYSHARKDSELQMALRINKSIFCKHLVRAIPIADPITRGLTELYAIAIHRPKANKVARLQAIPNYDET